MTKNEALTAMENGELLTHKYFTDEEWVKKESGSGRYLFEDGCRCSPQDFWRTRNFPEWEDGWSIFTG